MIGRSALSDRARATAVAWMTRLAEAEAAIHNMPVESVHLHEVGAIDAIVDVVGAVCALECFFGADRIACAPLNVGGGMVRCAHGVFPVPHASPVSVAEVAVSEGRPTPVPSVGEAGAVAAGVHARSPRPGRRRPGSSTTA